MLDRSIADLPGSFNTKVVKGIPYWYWQYRDLIDAGKLKQIYLGPDDARLRKLILQRQEAVEARKLKKDQPSPQGPDGLPGLVAACISLGCMAVLPQHFKVISRLAEHGFFRAGGTLVGTHAFHAMSNMLGVRWMQGWQTNDIDFAHPGTNVSLALPANVEMNVHDAITSLEMGLLPRTSIVDKGASYQTPNKELRIDLLTTIGKKPGIRRNEQLKVNLEPLKFMEFSLEKTTQTVILSEENALVVNIPAPMRYAVHKLLVMAERQEGFHAKLRKDARQIASLVSYGLERSPTALKAAAQDIMDRGRGWRGRIKEGMVQFASFHPDIAQELAGILGIPGK